MDVTDELRRMLDERGVEWMPIAWNPKMETYYHTSNGVGFCADEYADGVKIYTDATITPEQAIEATLGRGTCKVVYCEDSYGTDGWHCKECGEWFAATFRHKGHNNLVIPYYCPNCGREVVEEEDDE